MMSNSIPLHKRFFRFVVIPDDPDACWRWIGGTDRKGYGKMGGGPPLHKTVIASRVSYEIHIGPIPAGLNVLHRCDNPPCCNPAHLFPGTTMDNIHDMMNKGRRVQAPPLRGDDSPARKHPERMARGERNGQNTHPERRATGDRNASRLYPERRPKGEGHALAKLNDETVRAMRLRYDAGNVTLKQVSAEFGVPLPTVHDVVSRRSWKHVE